MKFRNGKGAKGLCYPVLNNGQPEREEPMNKTKPYEISRYVVLEAFERVKANKGAAGIDGESLEAFEADLKNNLYKIWNRMSSGSYFPPPVKAVEIPKKTGGKRVLGIPTPTVADRVAQMTVKLYFEPQVALPSRFLWVPSRKIGYRCSWRNSEAMLEIRLDTGI
jgi:RNA-directed DNA polymerase